MLKRLLSIVLAVVMVISCCSFAAFAEENDAEKTFNYVALGDSIAAGYGLVDAGALNKDPSLLITDDLLANPIEDAYPALFGAYLKEIGQQYGYTVNTTNLAAPAFRAVDIAHIISDPEYIPENAAHFLETYGVEGVRDAYKNYHDIFVKYLADADLISIEIGINDISDGVFTPMTTSDNPVLKAIGTAVLRTFNGSDTTTVMNTVKQILNDNRDKINSQTVNEAAEYITNVLSNPEGLIENSAEQVQAVVEAVRSINPDADIALINQYNPFGNSDEYDGQTYNAYNVIKNIFIKSIDYLSNDEAEQVPVAQILSQFGTLLSDETAYPLQYSLLGKNLDSIILSLNEKLQAIAEENDLIYIDIYNEVSNKKSLDPHPDAQGHQEIADALKTQLTELVIERMTGEVPENDSYTITRISNPDGKEREVDGLIDDRGTSYTWRMAQRGDYIYIATYRNLLNGVISIFQRTLASQGVSSDLVWALTDAVTNGEIPKAEDTDGAYIIKFNTKTGEFSKVFTFPYLMQCRMVVNYDGNIYAGSYSSVLPRQNLYKIDENDEVSIVFSTSESFSIRANCVYDAGEGDHLYFAGADEREVLEEGDENCCRIAVWEKDADDDTVWNRVANYKDFYDYAADVNMKNSSGCPIWELAVHNGYIYASMPYSKGFIIFRGRPAEDGEEANEYGWIWEEVVGAKNGINHPGMAATSEGHADINFSALSSVYEFNGELYCFDVDQTILAELAFIQGALYQAAGQDVTLSDMIKPVYETLHHTQHLWKLNDETGVFEECEGFTELMEGSCNEYVWRAQEHNGYMYVSTMDSAVIYNYITRLTNGSLSKMSDEEIEEQITYISNLIDLLEPVISDSISQKLVEALEKYKEMLEQVSSSENSEEDIQAFMDEYENILSELKETIAKFKTAVSGEVDSSYEEFLKDNLDESDANAELAVVAAAIADEDGEEIPEDMDETAIIDTLKDYFSEISSTATKKLKASALALLSGLMNEISESIDKIDWEGMRMYLWVSETVKNDTWGFDLVRTKDGVNFELVTNDGFGDKYNYGCPSFLSTDEGLYIGTCNPFYGAQLYLLADESAPVDPDDPYDPDEPMMPELLNWYRLGDADGDGTVTIVDATIIQRYLAGIISEEYIDLVAAAVSGKKVTITDATFIQRFLASLEVPYPIGEKFNRETGERQETIEETVLADLNGVKVTAHSFDREYDHPFLNMTIENSSDKDMSIAFDPVTVNGYQVDAYICIDTEDGGSYEYEVTVKAGETLETRLEVNDGYLIEHFLPVVADMTMNVHIQDPDTFESLASQKAVLRTSAYESFDYQFDESGTVIYDANGIKIVQKETIDDEFGKVFTFYFSNQTEKDIDVRLATATIDGQKADAGFSAYIYSGNRAIAYLSFIDAPESGGTAQVSFRICEVNQKTGKETVQDTTDLFSLTL